MTSVKQKVFLNKKIDFSDVIIAVMLVFTGLSGLTNQMLLSLGIAICCIALLLCNKLYLGFPFMLFYGSFYGMVFGLSVFRIYTLLVLLNLIMRVGNKCVLRLKYFLPFMVYIIYLTVVMIPLGTSGAIFIFLDILTCFIIVWNLIDDTQRLRSFFKIYVIVCLISFISGSISGNIIGDEYHEIRFMATFEDPNYMGFFYTMAIFAIVTLKLFDKRLRYILVVVLYAMILTSLSITAIVVNAVIWFFYLIVMKKLKWWSIIIVAVVTMIMVSLYNYGIDNPDTPILGDFSARIEEKLDDLESGDLNDMTTNRTDLTKEHYEYYLSGSVWNKLFGGIPSNTRYIHPDLGAGGHNEYVDMLLNIGIIGTSVMFTFFVMNLVSNIKKYRQSRENKYLFLITTKAIWGVYAISLTMFLDYRFLFVFLI